jgi:hypothetical protein
MHARRHRLQVSPPRAIQSAANESSLGPDLPPPPPTPPASRPRFVGDLNPESIFHPTSPRDLSQCGVWASPAASAPTHTIPRAYAAYLDSIGAFTLPPSQAQEGLLAVYFASVHPLLPLIDSETSFRDHLRKQTLSVPLLHAVLLVAARHPAAAPFLPSAARSFAAMTAEKVTALLHGGVEKDRTTLVRIHALLALHSEGAGGNEAASLHLSTAVHHAFTLGLHMHRAGVEEGEKRLWWCLWALDTLQASLCGRPVGVRREDISLPWPAGDGHKKDPFKAFLKIAAMLTDVIALYRPGCILPGWDDTEWPPLESVVPEALPNDIANTLTLFYHAVTILSQRRSGGGQRRRTSAEAVVRMWPAQAETLGLAVVPYAVGLALSSFFREGDRAGFESACEILEELGNLWWFAAAMARMGRSVVVKEAAGVLTGLQEDRGATKRPRLESDVTGDAAEVPPPLWGDNGDGVEAWFLQLFPDLAFPASFGEGMGAWDAGAMGLGFAGGGTDDAEGAVIFSGPL